MKKMGMLGDVAGQLGSLGKQTVKTLVKTPKDLAKTAASQIGMENKSSDEKKVTQQIENPQGDTTKNDTEDIVKSLYGVSDGSKADVKPDQSQNPDQQEVKTPEEQQDLQKVRQQLQVQHKQTYYDPTFNRPKPQEERPAEKVEREKMEELQLEQKKKEKKPKNLAVQRAQQSAEKFRGVSG